MLDVVLKRFEAPDEIRTLENYPSWWHCNRPRRGRTGMEVARACQPGR
jgi:hypothetical protein